MTITDEPFVHIVDDDDAVRDSLRELVEAAGLRATTYGSAEDFLAVRDDTTAGCLVLDIRMAGLNGLDLQQVLRDRQCDLPVIIITGHGDVPAATRAFKQGAVDFIQKPFNPAQLLGRIREALDKGRHARRNRITQDDLRARLARLSARELEVMDLVITGHLNKQIAARLGIAERTVEDHRARVMRAMGADSVAQLVRLAVLCGR